MTRFLVKLTYCDHESASCIPVLSFIDDLIDIFTERQTLLHAYSQPGACLCTLAAIPALYYASRERRITQNRPPVPFGHPPWHTGYLFQQIGPYFPENSYFTDTHSSSPSSSLLNSSLSNNITLRIHLWNQQCVHLKEFRFPGNPDISW